MSCPRSSIAGVFSATHSGCSSRMRRSSSRTFPPSPMCGGHGNGRLESPHHTCAVRQMPGRARAATEHLSLENQALRSALVDITHDNESLRLRVADLEEQLRLTRAVNEQS